MTRLIHVCSDAKAAYLAIVLIFCHIYMVQKIGGHMKPTIPSVVRCERGVGAGFNVAHSN